MQQIKDVVAWELDRLSQDLHEQVFGSQHPFSNLLGPANRHSRAPRVSELAAELAPPLFDSGVPGGCAAVGLVRCSISKSVRNFLSCCKRHEKTAQSFVKGSLTLA
ncbi:Cacna1h [Symbiodinium sp. CCMP2456]|nr:Cacna1h [Symbiodinium sp. CCMP2456]